MACDDCGAYGHKTIRTPNLDKLAKDGLRFDRAFLTCSSCSPSRSSILTSRYPHNTGAEQLHWPLPAEQTTFPDPQEEWILDRCGGKRTSATTPAAALTFSPDVAKMALTARPAA
jgi:hypothetical protein